MRFPEESTSHMGKALFISELISGNAFLLCLDFFDVPDLLFLAAFGPFAFRFLSPEFSAAENAKRFAAA